MQFPAQFRRNLPPALLAMFVMAGASMLAAQPNGRSSPGSRPMAIQQRSGPVGPGAVGPGAVGPRRNQEHLAQWLQRHSNLSLPEQQRALQNEPGFRDLPPQTQQRMLDRLNQLNHMPPEKRRQVIDRTEAMERLSLPQRQQVRGAMQQLGSLPEDRRRAVARAFREIRELPGPQRQSMLNSSRFRSEFSEQERHTLSSLIAVEPYLPLPPPREGSR